jgi:acetoin utilization protein AcuB
MKLEQIMSTRVIAVGMDDKLETIQALFERFRFHHLIVLGENDILVGVVSDRDLLKALSPFISTLVERIQDLRTLKKPVHQIMARKPITASKDLAVEEAAVLMLNKGISCLPIVRADRTVEGIVTDKDILRWLVKQMGHGGTK